MINLIKYKKYENKINLIYMLSITLLSIIAGIISTYNKSAIFLIGILFILTISLIFFNTNKKYVYILISLLVLNESLFYLLPKNFSSIVAIVSLILFMFRLDIVLNKKYLFKNIILSLIFICFISQIGAFIKFKQPIILGIFGMHFIFIYLYYFYFVDLFESKIKYINIDIIIKIIIAIGTIMSILYIIQMVIYPNIIIFNMSYSYRDGSVRFFTGYILIMFSVILTYSKLLECLNIKLLICMLVQIASIIIVSKTRNFIIGIAISLIVGIFIKNKINKLMLALCIGFISIISVSLINDNFFIEMIKEIIFELKNKSGTIGVRVFEFEYYMNLLRDNPLTGIGLLDSRFELTPIITGFDPYYYFVGDLGLLGVLIQCGLIGGIWMIIFFKKMYQYGKKIIKLNIKNSYLMILTLSLIIGTFSSGFIFDKGSIMYICLFLAISEVSWKNKLNEIGDN